MAIAVQYSSLHLSRILWKSSNQERLSRQERRFLLELREGRDIAYLFRAAWELGSPILMVVFFSTVSSPFPLGVETAALIVCTGDPMITLPNVVLTPHNAGLTPEATINGLMMAVENVEAFLANKEIDPTCLVVKGSR